MQKIKVYYYGSEQGYISTPIDLKIEGGKILYRLFPENGKILTNGTVRLNVVETTEDKISLWEEIERREDEKIESIDFINPLTPIQEDEQEINYKRLLDIVTGNEEQ